MNVNNSASNSNAYNAVLYSKRGENRTRLIINYVDKNGTTHDEVYVSTSAEMIVEAVEQLKPTDYPFTCEIEINNNGYYKFI